MLILTINSFASHFYILVLWAVILFWTQLLDVANFNLEDEIFPDFASKTTENGHRYFLGIPSLKNHWYFTGITAEKRPYFLSIAAEITAAIFVVNRQYLHSFFELNRVTALIFR